MPVDKKKGQIGIRNRNETASKPKSVDRTLHIPKHLRTRTQSKTSFVIVRLATEAKEVSMEPTQGTWDERASGTGTHFERR